jgi:isochorismate hydrolase
MLLAATPSGAVKESLQSLSGGKPGAMGHPRILDSKQAVLLIVDVQESFRKQLKDLDNLTRNITILAEASKILRVPVILTEQYPQGLGKTIAEISACLGEHKYFEKTSFSCCQAAGFMEMLESMGRNQVVICGIEAHVCVSQTAHELLVHDYSVHVVADAIASRSPRNKETGWEKMIASGAVPACVESALFEMLVEAGTEQFKAVQRLVK